MKKRRYGFRGKNQLPLFQIWEKDWEDGEVIFARVIFQIYPKWLQQKDRIPQ